MRAKKEADLAYAVAIGVDGVPTAAKRLVPADLDGDAALIAMDEESRRAILAARWRPFRVDGQAVACTLVHRVNFSFGAPPPPGDDGFDIADRCPKDDLATKIEGTVL